MNVKTNSTLMPLVYNGEIITQRDEMLSLTDMWKAAGSPSGRAPNDWKALASTVAFSDHVADVLIAGKSGSDLFNTVVGGRRPGTWAHWQIGLAYAKYLSPEFHMWCNTVVRDRMEGRGAAARVTNPRDAHVAFRSFLSIGKLIGLDRNEASLAANRATLKTVGIDVLATMDATHLLAETQDELLTATVIGQRLDGLSAQSINKRLQALGFHQSGPDGHGGKMWSPTEIGKQYGRWFDTSKKHSDGASVLQWKWFGSIVEEIAGETPLSLIQAETTS